MRTCDQVTRFVRCAAPASHVFTPKAAVWADARYLCHKHAARYEGRSAVAPLVLGGTTIDGATR